jgi:hypothetical protein
MILNLLPGRLSLTPRFSGVQMPFWRGATALAVSRTVNGFQNREITAEAVNILSTDPNTPLKRGANETVVLRKLNIRRLVNDST